MKEKKYLILPNGEEKKRSKPSKIAWYRSG
jgi:hypothetical protein